MQSGEADYIPVFLSEVPNLFRARILPLASLSPGGKPVIALPSVTSKGEPRIVPLLQPGAGVVTTRAHVHWVVTEHGVAHLYGKNLRQRARALITVADPRHREGLERAAQDRFGRLPST